MAQPHELWEQARSDHPQDRDARGRRYVQLMREAGLIVPREPGDDTPMFACGYEPHRAEWKEVAAHEAADKGAEQVTGPNE